MNGHPERSGSPESSSEVIWPHLNTKSETPADLIAIVAITETLSIQIRVPSESLCDGAGTLPH